MATGANRTEDQIMGRRVCGLAASCIAGLGIWFATIAPVPDGVYVSSTRILLLWIAMIAAAAILGYVLANDGRLVALGLAGAPLMTAAWTASRGDGDGLWVLFFPYLVFMGFILLFVAWLAGRLRAWLIWTSPRGGEGIERSAD